MSNLTVSATTTPYAGVVSTTGSSSSTTVSNTSSATAKTVTSSTTPSSSTTAKQSVNVASSSNTATMSSSTTYAYGSSASNSTSKMVSSTTVYATSSSTSPNVTSSSTTPNVTSSSTTPNVTSSSTMPNVTSSSTTPNVTSSSTTPSVTSSSRTNVQNSGEVIKSSSNKTDILESVEEYSSTYYPKGYVTSAKRIVMELEEQGNSKVNEIDIKDEYSYNDVQDLMDSFKEKSVHNINELYNYFMEDGIGFSVNEHITISKIESPNATIELYLEIGKNTSNENTFITIENAFEDFVDEILSVDTLLGDFALTYANGCSVVLEDGEAYLSFEQDDTEIIINTKNFINPNKLDIAIEKKVEDENGGEFSIGLKLEVGWNDDLFEMAQIAVVNIVNNKAREFAYNNESLFDDWDMQMIEDGLYSVLDCFGNIASPKCGVMTTEEIEELQKISELKVEMNKYIQGEK